MIHDVAPSAEQQPGIEVVHVDGDTGEGLYEGAAPCLIGPRRTEVLRDALGDGARTASVLTSSLLIEARVRILGLERVAV